MSVRPKVRSFNQKHDNKNPNLFGHDQEQDDFSFQLKAQHSADDHNQLLVGRLRQEFECVRRQMISSHPVVKHQLLLELAKDPDVCDKYVVVEKMCFLASDGHIERKMPDLKLRPKSIEKHLDFEVKKSDKLDSTNHFFFDNEETRMKQVKSGKDERDSVFDNVELKQSVIESKSFLKVAKAEEPGQVRKEEDHRQGTVGEIQDKLNVAANEQNDANQQPSGRFISDDCSEMSHEMLLLFRKFLKFMKQEKERTALEAKEDGTEQTTLANEVVEDLFEVIDNYETGLQNDAIHNLERVSQTRSPEKGAVGGDSQEIKEKPEIRCPICLEYLNVSDFITIIGCEHVICFDCLVGYLTSKINDGQIDEIPCPGEGCVFTVPYETITRILDLDVLKKYKKLLLKRTVSEYEDVYECPQCGEQIQCKIDDDGLGECPNLDCQFVFCGKCMGQFHGGFDCHLNEDEKRQVIEAYKLDEAEKALQIMEEARQRRENENQTAHTFIKSNYKECPSCHTDVEKISGCNHMTCKCGTHFCYKCSGWMDPRDPSVHYNSGSCRGRLHD